MTNSRKYLVDPRLAAYSVKLEERVAAALSAPRSRGISKLWATDDYVDVLETQDLIASWFPSSTQQSINDLCNAQLKKTKWRYYLARKDKYNTYPSATGHMRPWYKQNSKY